MDAEFLDQRDLSERWDISPRTLEKWRTQRTGPRFIKIGGRVRYRRSDVEAWEESRSRSVAPLDNAEAEDPAKVE